MTPQIISIEGNYSQCYPKFDLLDLGNSLLSERKHKRKAPLTVCIAAICDGGIIIGASDRMITSGDIEFEPSGMPLAPPAKIFQLTSSIAIMTAGDSGLQSEIIQNLIPIVNERIRAEPNQWLPVKAVVDGYVNCYTKLKLQCARNAILAPLGLDENRFVSQQQGMSPVFVERITREMLNFDMPGVETIVTGIDTAPSTNPRAHIYTIRNNDVTCCDDIGFAAVGIGARHAESQFMLAGHTRFSPLPE